MARAGLDTAAVVAAACELADAQGLESLTLAGLAGELGVRPPSLYAHVGGLEDLRRRIGLRAGEELAARLRSVATGRARRDALQAVADEYRSYARERPGRYAALQRPPAPADEPSAGAPGELVELVLGVLRGYDLTGEETLHAARVVRSALHGFVLLEAQEGFRISLDLDRSFAHLIAVLDAGLCSPTTWCEGSDRP